jgi:hypothetical protein
VREAKTKWAAANPEKVKAARRKRAAANSEYAKRWAAANPEKMRGARRKWATANSEKVLAINRGRRQWVKARLARHKRMRGCEDCGLREPDRLVYHHLDPDQKLFTIGHKAERSWDSIKAEVAKCTVLCRPCHVVRHQAMK